MKKAMRKPSRPSRPCHFCCKTVPDELCPPQAHIIFALKLVISSMVNELTEQQVSTALTTVKTPGRDRDLVAGGQVSGIVIKDGHVGFTIEIDPSEKDHADQIRNASESAVRALDGVLSATAMLTAHQAAGAGDTDSSGGRRARRFAAPFVEWLRTAEVVADNRGTGGGEEAVEVARAMTDDERSR